MIVFPESYRSDSEERLIGRIRDNHAMTEGQRVAEIRKRLRALIAGRKPLDAALLVRHAQTLRTILQVSSLRREEFNTPAALFAAIILRAPLPGIDDHERELLGLHSAEFVKVVETFDRQQAKAASAESA
ncbi:MAG: hypothetical protein IPH06_02720 [Alphaproteobacteria bacterium]|nr:hypothetical protein [Alphaproteobacteria bacterium]QQS56957.1 MAG: hypothetical protein IPN28_11975 [Alphaproteobacteria bacterium]